MFLIYNLVPQERAGPKILLAVEKWLMFHIIWGEGNRFIDGGVFNKKCKSVVPC